MKWRKEKERVDELFLIPLNPATPKARMAPEVFFQLCETVNSLLLKPVWASFYVTCTQEASPSQKSPTLRSLDTWGGCNLSQRPCQTRRSHNPVLGLSVVCVFHFLLCPPGCPIPELGKSSCSGSI